MIPVQTCCKIRQFWWIYNPSNLSNLAKPQNVMPSFIILITLTFLFVILCKNTIFHWDTNYAFCDYDFLLYKLGMLAHAQLLQANLHSTLCLWDFDRKAETSWISNIASNRNLWTRVGWSAVTTSPFKMHHRLSLTPPCPLIFYVLSALSLSNFISVLSLSFTSSFFLFIPSSCLAFFTSSLALFSRELRHHYSVRWLTFHPLSY